MKAAFVRSPRVKPKIRAAAANGVRKAITHRRVAADRVLERAGIDAGQLEDPAYQLELGDYCRLMESAAEATGDDLFGARFGIEFSPPNFGPVGEIAMNSATLGEALRALSAYYGWIQQNSGLELKKADGIAVLEYQIFDSRILERRQDAELSIAAFASLIRHCIGPGWQPLEVHFEHGSSGSRADYRRVFRADPVFYEKSAAIILDAADLDRPIRRADWRRRNQALESVREQLADDLIDGARLESEAVIATATRLIERQIRGDGVSLQAVARRMGMSPHRLRTHLRERGIAFDELLSETRRRIAMDFVENSDRSMTEIAYLLGYSEASAFSRAFRNWTGTGPAAYRRHLHGVGDGNSGKGELHFD